MSSVKNDAILEGLNGLKNQFSEEAEKIRAEGLANNDLWGEKKAQDMEAHGEAIDKVIELLDSDPEQAKSRLGRIMGQLTELAGFNVEMRGGTIFTTGGVFDSHGKDNEAMYRGLADSVREVHKMITFPPRPGVMGRFARMYTPS